MKYVKTVWALLSLVALITAGQATCVDNAKAFDIMDEICPQCNSEDTVPIIYGYPSPDLWDEVDKGEVMLGG